MRVHLFVLAAAALLGACQTTSYQGDENSPFYAVPTGSRLIVNRDLPIASGQLRVFIQDGRVLSNSEVQHRYPYCSVELRDLSDGPRTVGPDELVVTRTLQHEQQGLMANNGGVVYARLGFLQQIEMGGPPGGPTEATFATIMDVRSDKQPQVRRVTCSQWGYQGFDRHVTIAEIRHTLGDLVTLRIR